MTDGVQSMPSVKIMGVVVLALILALSSPDAYAARESVQVTKLANPVTTDGKWTTPSEWSDTNRVSMYLLQGPQSTGYVRLKHDGDWLYLLVDFVSDTTSASTQGTGGGGDTYDGVFVAIDKHVNDTKTESDESFMLQWKNGESAPNLNGYGEVSPVAPTVGGLMSYNATNDPDSEKTHVIYELVIPMTTFADPSAVRISVWDWSRGVNMHWPKGPSHSWNTTYFGDLVFSDVVVPELPSPALLLLLSLVVTYAIVRRRMCATKRPE